MWWTSFILEHSFPPFGGFPCPLSYALSFVSWTLFFPLLGGRIILSFWWKCILSWGASRGSDSKESACNRRPWFDSCVREDPLERKWLPTQVFWPGEFHGWRSLAGYSLCGCKVRHEPLTHTYHRNNFLQNLKGTAPQSLSNRAVQKLKANMIPYIFYVSMWLVLFSLEAYNLSSFSWGEGSLNFIWSILSIWILMLFSFMEFSWIIMISALHFFCYRNSCYLVFNFSHWLVLYFS